MGIDYDQNRNTSSHAPFAQIRVNHRSINMARYLPEYEGDSSILQNILTPEASSFTHAYEGILYKSEEKDPGPVPELYRYASPVCTATPPKVAGATPEILGRVQGGTPCVVDIAFFVQRLSFSSLPKAADAPSVGPVEQYVGGVSPVTMEQLFAVLREDYDNCRSLEGRVLLYAQLMKMVGLPITGAKPVYVLHPKTESELLLRIRVLFRSQFKHSIGLVSGQHRCLASIMQGYQYVCSADYKMKASPVLTVSPPHGPEDNWFHVSASLKLLIGQVDGKIVDRLLSVSQSQQFNEVSYSEATSIRDM